MSSPTETPSAPKLDLAAWAQLPNRLVLGGGILLVLGFLIPSWRPQFFYSYLVAFMFFLSLMLGGLFLTLVHHMFDTYWLVPVRRLTEHLACMAPVLGILFLPILLGATQIYPWMSIDPHADHALHVKAVMFNKPAFWVVSILLFVVWTWVTGALRRHSLEQDKTGDASHTFAMRRLTGVGIFLFAITLTLGVIYWMKSLEHQWFSTMYGVYYFAGSVWTTLATLYVISTILHRTGHLAPIIQQKTFHDMGVLFFAFTVFYAYIHFSQYFLIWNAAIPEETFWYVKRENGIWWSVGMIIIFGHFFVPFLGLLRIDAKKSLTLMLPMGLWAWLMHFTDMTFNIKPVLDPAGAGISLPGFVLSIAAMAFMGGVLAKKFLKDFATHPPFPQRDPRVAETVGVYVEPESVSAAKAK